MNPLEPNRLEGILCLLCVLFLIASWVFRLRVFVRSGDDPVIAEAVRGTSPLSFGDTLSVSLFRQRHRLLQDSRRSVFGYIGLYWSGSALILLMFISYGARNWP